MVKYDNHAAQYSTISEERRSAAEMRNVSFDSWREARTMAPLIQFCRVGSDASWLTVGDGVFGNDAVGLKRMGVKNVHASDMSDHLLRQALEKGHIDACSAQNAEQLTFGDEAFDYVLCKNSFHHFPRPMIAVYEMLRVARRAIVLVEPPDPVIGFSLRSFVQRRIGRQFHDFEQVGNYVYWVSEREFEKLLLGIGLRHCAFRSGNDIYWGGIEHVPITGGTLVHRTKRAKTKAWAAVRDALTCFGIMMPNTLISVLFKGIPAEQEMCALRDCGFRIRALPINPHSG